MRRLLLPFLIIILLAGCTQTPGTTPGAQSQPQQTQQQQQQVVDNAPVNVAAQFAELGAPITGTSNAILVEAKYSMEVSGQACEVFLKYEMSDCSDSEPTKTGNTYSFCASPYSYSLTSTCDVASLASQLKADPYVNGKKFTTDVWIPWYGLATDVSVSLVLTKGTSTVTYLYATGMYQSSYPSSGNYLVFKDPANYIIVQGDNAQSTLGDIRGMIGSNEYKPSTEVLNYIPSDWYGTGLVPYLCYNPYGLLTADPGLFSWADDRFEGKFDPMMKLISPASFVLGPVSPYLGGNQLENIGQNFNRIEDYENRYKMCKVYNCYEGCNKDNVLVLSKGDCTTVRSSPSSKPPITNKFYSIVKIISGMKYFTGTDDYVCFGLLDSKAGDIFLGDYKTGKGIIYGRPMIVDRSVHFVIAEDITDARDFLTYLLNTKLSTQKQYTLRTSSNSGDCTLYTWGSSTDLSGYAGHCAENDGLTLLFFNICNRDENCDSSAQAFFNAVSK